MGTSSFCWSTARLQFYHWQNCLKNLYSEGAVRHIYASIIALWVLCRLRVLQGKTRSKIFGILKLQKKNIRMRMTWLVLFMRSSAKI